MKHRRNLAVAAVTAAIVTTALVGTTLPGLVADRTSDGSAVEQTNDQNLSDETLVRTDLPEVLSVEEISTAAESADARDQMIIDIVGRIDQAVDRAEELELELMRQHSLAIAELEEASELREEAEQAQREAEAAMALDASDDYQSSDTSAADVLLGEGDTLADDATDQQLDEQAEQDAAAALQRQREAEDRAEAQDEVAAASLGDLGAEEARILQQRREADQRTCELLETLQEEESFEGSLDDFLLWLYNREELSETGTGYFAEDGAIDCDAVTARISQLRTPASAETDEAGTAASNQTTEDSSDEAEGEAESSEESEVTPSDSPSPSPSETATSTPSPSATPSATPTPSPSESPTESSAASYDSLSSEQKDLLAEAAELDTNFDGGARDYYQLILDNDLFTTSSGSASWTVVEGEVTRLRNQAAEAEAEASSSPSPSPSQSSSSAPSSSPSSSPSPTPTPTPTPSSTPSQTSAPSSTPTQTSSPSSSPSQTPRIPHWDDLSQELRGLLVEGSNIDPRFDGGSGGDYWRWIPANRPDLLNSDGTVSTSRLATHLSGLRSSSSSSPSPSPTQTQTSTPRPTQSSGNQPAGNSGSSGAAQIALSWARNEATRSGTSYVLGANGPNAWDCSSFVQAAYARAGVSLGRTTYAQLTQGRQVSWSDRQPGDLIFWGNYHVAIYLGGGMIADAGSPSSGVSIRPIFQSHNISQVRRVG
ncbi:C40 family peptidase [Nesterenkonia ebinurensis]|uniref:C40 family peptidase n=1 Tax=Nesterenkonia ebinurensis TaxID=2608252 RepID=UPI00123C7E03|nr:C40 family peptidase [Nesterenkonia ebinurensis]